MLKVTGQNLTSYFLLPANSLFTAKPMRSIVKGFFIYSPAPNRRASFTRSVSEKPLTISARMLNFQGQTICRRRVLVQSRIVLLQSRIGPRFRPVPSFYAPVQEEIETFRKVLETYEVFYRIRRSRGWDISAACGLLP